MIKLGVSACVIGDKVRFDSGHKRSHFLCDELSEYVKFVPVCPEVAIGLPVPRPTIRLMEKNGIDIHLVETKNNQIDYTEKMLSFSQKKASQLANDELCGYVVCAKSPTCGMQRVKLYLENGNASNKHAIGLYTQQLMQKMPWLPIEEDGRMNDPLLRENFIERIFALRDFYDAMQYGVTRSAIVDFHSRYKLILMAHSIKAYQELGRLVAKVAEYDHEEFFQIYRLQFMQALAKMATRKSHTNVLMHLQGYFKKQLSKEQKAELTKLIKAYREKNMPLLAPLTLINHYLREYPDPYLAMQKYLEPYPQALRLRYGL